MDQSEEEEVIAESPTPEYKATGAKRVVVENERAVEVRPSFVREARSGLPRNSPMIHTLRLRRSNVDISLRKHCQMVMNWYAIRWGIASSMVSLFKGPRSSGHDRRKNDLYLADEVGSDTLPDTASGQGSHGAAKPDSVIHTVYKTIDVCSADSFVTKLLSFILFLLNKSSYSLRQFS
jgi:hypothetical protein